MVIVIRATVMLTNVLLTRSLIRDSPSAAYMLRSWSRSSRKLEGA